MCQFPGSSFHSTIYSLVSAKRTTALSAGWSKPAITKANLKTARGVCDLGSGLLTVSLNIFSAAFSTAPSSAAGHLPTPTSRQARPPTISMPRACPPSEAGRADGDRVNHETEVAEVNVEEGVASSPFFVSRGESVASLLLVTCHLQRQEAVTLFLEFSAQYEITLLLRVLKLGTFAVLVAVEPNVTV